MAVESLDATDWRLLALLQEDGRLGVAALARSVSMSASAVAERLRRLEATGVIEGYTARVDATKLGAGIVAFVRVRHQAGNHQPLRDLLATMPQVLEAHHVTGEDCFILKVVATSMAGLERTTGRLAALGPTTTNIVYSSPIPRRPVVGETVA